MDPSKQQAGPMLTPAEGVGLTSSKQAVEGMTVYGTESLCGTTEGAKIWCNKHDKVGIAMAVITWGCIIYGAFTIIWVTLYVGTFNPINAYIYLFFTFMSLWAHFKTMTTDPGAIPRNAQPVQIANRRGTPGNVCGRCDAYKPSRSHHCRTCGRCIVRMDHHCPWMNNCIGATNLKFFLLFLVYTEVCCVYCIVLVLIHFIHCQAEDCESYKKGGANLTRAALVLAFAGCLFVTSMLVNQVNGVLTGIGTVDRMQRRRKERSRNVPEPQHVPVRWRDVFGRGPIIWWFFPIDFEFEDRSSALLYTVPASSSRTNTRRDYANV